MATRKSGTPGHSGASRPRDKGTRGGRPEPVLASTGSPQQRGAPAPATAPAEASAVAETSGVASQARASRNPARQNGQAVVEEQTVPRWYQAVTFALAACGLGVSIYLTVTHFTNPKALICSDKGLINCTAVTTSPQSYVLGIPVAVLGLAFYVFLFAINSPLGWRIRWSLMGAVRLGSMIVGMLFVLYLIYAELIIIKAICLWCSGVHLLTFLLFALTMFGVSAGYLKVRLPGTKRT